MGHFFSIRFFVLLAGICAIWQTLSGAPSFNASLRKQNVYGHWAAGTSNDMFDPGSYYFQLAYGYLHADALFSVDTEGRGEVASAAVAFSRFESARELLQASLSFDPANAHAWAELAWSLSLTGDVASARAALARSWILAPYNPVLANRRLGLGIAITEDTFMMQIELSNDEVQSFRRDFELLKGVRPKAASLLNDDYPAFFAQLAMPSGDVN